MLFRARLMVRRRRRLVMRRWRFIRFYEFLGKLMSFWETPRTFMKMMNNISGTRVPRFCPRRDYILSFLLCICRGPSPRFKNCEENPRIVPVIFRLCPTVWGSLLVGDICLRGPSPRLKLRIVVLAYTFRKKRRISGRLSSFVTERLRGHTFLMPSVKGFGRG
jgi:hypothetical protein